MTQIILDANLASKLQELAQMVELCDPTGRVVGRFVPLIDLERWDAELASRLGGSAGAVELRDPSGHLVGRFAPGPGAGLDDRGRPPISEEELQRREQEPDYSTAEVLAYLEKQ